MTFCTSLFGNLLAREEFQSMRDTPPPMESPERRQRGSQLWFDPLLADCVRSYPKIALKYGWRLDRFGQDANSVKATCIDEASGRPVDIEAQYLVACDGAGSTVRKALGIEMLGNPVLSHSVGIFFRSPELYRRHGKGDTERFVLVGESGPWGALTAIDGRSLWRLTLYRTEARMELSQEEVDREILRMSGAPFEYEVINVLPWRRSQLVADHYGKGRVWIAGDAVHTMSPTGGFGMNTGMGDAVDLGWKLSALLEGWGGDKLLESYNAERQPVGRRAIDAAARTFKALISAKDYSVVTDTSPETAAARAEIGRKLREATYGEWDSHTLGVQLGYRYEGSPICLPDGTVPPPDDHVDYQPSARPGSRAPHAWLPDGRSTLDLFGRGFVLLSFGGAAGSAQPLMDAAAKRGVPITLVSIDDNHIAGLYERRYVLVRPDGHVAWRHDEMPHDALAVIDRVRGAAVGAVAANIKTEASDHCQPA
jgi:2-polyprenyl-6-methoxyphenol hydroxylase-like FAD-dependent oxidoreductase